MGTVHLVYTADERRVRIVFGVLMDEDVLQATLSSGRYPFLFLIFQELANQE